jgi:hypothetical protein
MLQLQKRLSGEAKALVLAFRAFLNSFKRRKRMLLQQQQQQQSSSTQQRQRPNTRRWWITEAFHCTPAVQLRLGSSKRAELVRFQLSPQACPADPARTLWSRAHEHSRRQPAVF